MVDQLHNVALLQAGPGRSGDECHSQAVKAILGHVDRLEKVGPIFGGITGDVAGVGSSFCFEFDQVRQEGVMDRDFENFVSFAAKGHPFAFKIQCGHSDARFAESATAAIADQKGCLHPSALWWLLFQSGQDRRNVFIFDLGFLFWIQASDSHSGERVRRSEPAAHSFAHQHVQKLQFQQYRVVTALEDSRFWVAFFPEGEVIHAGCVGELGWAADFCFSHVSEQVFPCQAVTQSALWFSFVSDGEVGWNPVLPTVTFSFGVAAHFNSGPFISEFSGPACLGSIVSSELCGFVFQFTVSVAVVNPPKRRILSLVKMGHAASVVCRSIKSITDSKNPQRNCLIRYMQQGELNRRFDSAPSHHVVSCWECSVSEVFRNSRSSFRSSLRFFYAREGVCPDGFWLLNGRSIRRDSAAAGSVARWRMGSPAQVLSRAVGPNRTSATGMPRASEGENSGGNDPEPLGAAGRQAGGVSLFSRVIPVRPHWRTPAGSNPLARGFFGEMLQAAQKPPRSRGVCRRARGGLRHFTKNFMRLDRSCRRGVALSNKESMKPEKRRSRRVAPVSRPGAGAGLGLVSGLVFKSTAGSGRMRSMVGRGEGARKIFLPCGSGFWRIDLQGEARIEVSGRKRGGGEGRAAWMVGCGWGGESEAGAPRMAPGGGHAPHRIAPVGGHAPRRMAPGGGHAPHGMAPGGGHAPRRMAPEGGDAPHGIGI